MSSNQNLYNKISLQASNVKNQVVPKMYKGFSTVNANTENFKLYDFELIKQDLLNHFQIRQGERLMQPTFGAIIWDIIFEPLTDQTKALIIQNVNKIMNSDPRLQTERVMVTGYEFGIRIECTLRFLQYNISQKMQLQFDQTAGLSIR